MTITFRPPKTIRMDGQLPTQEDLAWDVLHERAFSRLADRIEMYAPPEMRGISIQDVVIVYRFPSKQRKHFIEKYDIIIPDKYRTEELPFSIGLLMCAGAEAMDVLASHGVLIGDIVRFAPLAGDEETEERVQEALQQAAMAGKNPEQTFEAVKKARDEEMEKKKLLRLKAQHIHESIDGLERLYGPKPTMETVRRVEKNGDPIYVIRPVIANLL